MGRKAVILVHGKDLFTWAKELGVSYQCLYFRYKQGLDENSLLCASKKRGRKKTVTVEATNTCDE